MTNNSRIMIVEDDCDTRELVQEFLESQGFAVDTFGNGKEALAALSTGQKPSAIFLDWRMPVMSGKEFLEAIHLTPGLAAGVPIYLFTAESDPRIGYDPSLAGTVQKPINLDRLLSLLDHLQQ